MRSTCIGLLALGLAACATTGTSSSTAQHEGWIDYRAEVTQERDRGALTATQAENEIEAKYRELYGRDPTMEGVFAYAEEVYGQATAGTLSLAEADALVKAREDEILARRQARAAYHDWMDKRFPSEPSD